MTLGAAPKILPCRTTTQPWRCRHSDVRATPFANSRNLLMCISIPRHFVGKTYTSCYILTIGSISFNRVQTPVFVDRLHNRNVVGLTVLEERDEYEISRLREV